MVNGNTIQFNFTSTDVRLLDSVLKKITKELITLCKFSGPIVLPVKENKHIRKIIISSDQNTKLYNFFENFIIPSGVELQIG